MANDVFHFEKSQARLHIAIRSAKFDAAAAEAFNQRLKDCWEADIRSVEVDMHQVDFIDSTGVGALLALSKKLPTEAPAVELQQPRPPVVSVLEMLRLHRVFRIV